MLKPLHPYLRRRRSRKEAHAASGAAQTEEAYPKADLPAFEGSPENELPERENEPDYLLEELELSLLAGSIIRRSRQLLKLHHLKTHPEETKSTPPRKRAPQIASSIDTHALKERLFQKFEEEHIYLHEGITLASLAREIDVDPHHLSRFLSIHLHITFTGLINSYRVDQAKALLARKPQETVLCIAFASGFNSKASFNRVFKKTTGMTPSGYRLKMKKS